MAAWAIPKQRANCLVVRLHELCQRVRRDQKDVPGGLTFDERTSEAKAIHVTGAAEVEVQRPRTLFEPEAVLKDAGAAGKEVIRALRAEEQENLRPRYIDDSTVQQFFCGTITEVARRLLRGGKMRRPSNSRLLHELSARSNSVFLRFAIRFLSRFPP